MPTERVNCHKYMKKKKNYIYFLVFTVFQHYASLFFIFLYEVSLFGTNL